MQSSRTSTARNLEMLQVTKAFSGLGETAGKLPDHKQLQQGRSIHGKVMQNRWKWNSRGSVHMDVLENVPDKTEVTFTESGYDVSGYEVTINQKATTDAEAGIVKATVVDKETVGAEFTNKYRQKLGNVTGNKSIQRLGETAGKLPDHKQLH